MMAANRIQTNLDEAECVVLLFLFQELVADHDLEFSVNEVADKLGNKIPRNFIQLNLSNLRTSKLVESQFVSGFSSKVLSSLTGQSERQHEVFRITREGVRKVEDWPDDFFERLNTSYLSEISNDEFGDEDQVPASDRLVNKTDNAWNEPDYVGELDDETEGRIRSLIQQAIEALPNAGLSNSDQSQAAARLEAAGKLANAPVPQWGKVREILAPMADVATIGAFIVSIITLIAVI